MTGRPPTDAQHWQRPDTDALSLDQVMALMRTRCPWAAAHTHATLEKYLLEETYELLEALRAGEPAEIVGELGDVLYQVIFHAALLDEQAGLEAGASMRRVESTLKAKLIRRHPHVFDSDGPVELAEVERRYEAIKAAERAAQRGAGDHGASQAEQDTAPEAVARAAESFASVPASMPALGRADAIIGRCERLGTAPVVPEDAGAVGDDHGLAGGLFALVAQAHAAGIDPEAALREYTAQVQQATVAAQSPTPEVD